MTGIPSYSAQYKISFIIAAKSKFVEQNFSKVIQCSGKIKELFKFNIYSNRHSSINLKILHIFARYKTTTCI